MDVEAPIGVFDSGVGGLTVVKEIMRQLPGENLVYFGDTARITDDMIGRYLHELKEYGIDSLILGCTHYPLIRNAIGRYMGPGVNLVNPAYETAKSLKVLLSEQGMLNKSGNMAAYEFFVSDGVDKFAAFADQVLPYHVERASVVDIESY